LGAPGRVVIGRAGKAQTTAMAGAMARICKADSNGCAALTQTVNGLRTENFLNINTLPFARSGQLPDLGSW
jgi:hypothetical protein